MILVKYRNRKLYWPEKRRYVVYKELAPLISVDGFKVIDHKTKTDITDEVKAAVTYYTIIKRY